MNYKGFWNRPIANLKVHCFLCEVASLILTSQKNCTKFVPFISPLVLFAWSLGSWTGPRSVMEVPSMSLLWMMCDP